jgi:hypothetical protein
MNTRVNLDAVRLAFDTTEKAALAATASGMVGKVSSMAASFLAQRGDRDPRRYFLLSSLLSSASALAVLGLVSAVPSLYLPVTLGVAAVGALAGTLGGAAGINLFNHLARGHSRGVVAAKNANQDLLADMLGMPVALGLSRLARALGLNPYLATLGVLGTALVVCNLKAASSLRFQSLDRGGLQEVLDSYIRGSGIPEAPAGSVRATLRSLFAPEGQGLKRVQFVDSLAPFAETGQNLEDLLRQFGGERYLLALAAPDRILVALRPEASGDDVVKACLHARLVERALEEGAAPAGLVELAARALPAGVKWVEELERRGWYLHPARLGIGPSRQSWEERPPRQRDPLTPGQFLELARGRGAGARAGKDAALPPRSEGGSPL